MPDTYNPLPALIDFASSLRYEDLPANVVHETKRRAIDAIACAMGGLSDERLQQRWRYLSKRQVAYPEGGLAYGAPPKLSLCDAAFLNSTMTRWLDFNDTYLAKEPAHPSDNFGLLFALSGAKQFSGRDLITAAAIAYDIQCRFTEAASLRSHGWDHVNYILISAALAGARLLGFDKDQMYNAVALALSSHGAMRQAREGTYLSEQKNMAAADAVRGAAWALEKVQSGSNGPAEIIEGKHGFVAQMSGPLEEAAFADLGEHFLIADTYIKQYPMEYHGQTVVEHALVLRQQLGAPKLSDVNEVVISGYEAQRTIIGDEPKRRPTTKETADHSVYYAFAAPFLTGRLTLDDYRPEIREDPEVLALIERTRFVEVPEWTQRY
ncbi:MAG TPA: MmgE/PrpD family protein, partial [Dehalococcoidia bacterium]|nr:MmgE/PrpD family protein [Dehalococcoidia bacterium]